MIIPLGWFTWLPEGEGRDGTLVRFIPGQNEEPAAVVKLDAVAERYDHLADAAEREQ